MASWHNGRLSITAWQHRVFQRSPLWQPLSGWFDSCQTRPWHCQFDSPPSIIGEVVGTSLFIICNYERLLEQVIQVSVLWNTYETSDFLFLVWAASYQSDLKRFVFDFQTSSIFIKISILSWENSKVKFVWIHWKT